MKSRYSPCFFLIFFFPLWLSAQMPDSVYAITHYTKMETMIPMRDGAKLFTSIYIPKDKTRKYPFLINRTPYTVAPYGADKYKTSLGNYPAIMKEGFIFVYQDVRGKWMSEGVFDDIRPHNPKKKSRKDIDESSDAYDTIDWLLKNIPNNNGKAGIYGISYPGFYSTASLPGSHPALKAVSPQAPVTDWFIGDDFHHNGVLFLQDAFSFMASFGVPRLKPLAPAAARNGAPLPVVDAYRFYLEAGTVRDLKEKYFSDSIRFWNNLFAHPDLDTFWQARNIQTHLKKVKPAVLVVGGAFDAEDTYGTFATYKSIEKQNPGIKNNLIIGPWYHGGWVRNAGSSLGDIEFGQETSKYYQEHFELPFFKYYLKNEGSFDPAEATIFVTGSNEWKKFNSWPPADVEMRELFLQAGGKLSFEKPRVQNSWDEYVSDPSKPVPYQAGVQQRRSREYMIDDQRFASRRPDVMVYQSEVLTEDLTLAGPLLAKLRVSTTGTDADYVVKLIDVYPEDAPAPQDKNIIMAGYQMLVRAEIMRGKYRNSFEKPEPFVPGVPTAVNYTLPDVAHTFKKGHRMMIQIQNSWFPLADRNPQKFMNIYEARTTDFQKATHRIYHDALNSSSIGIAVLR
ncbi:MAG: CocE/NonD family hydrolase [Arcticibacter sp.]